jgi:phenylalanine-4-hydroxylase
MNGKRPERVEYRHDGDSIIPVYTTDVVEQPYEDYLPDEHRLWGEMFMAQSALLRGRSVGSFPLHLDMLGLSPTELPRFSDVSAKLKSLTNWELVAVNGLLPAEAFFGRLAERRFPVTWWMRRRERRGYIEEPDLFHDLFGHTPMIADQRIANFLEAYGNAVLDVIDDPVAVARLGKLYWFTIEFGLANEGGVPHIFGSGLLSSFTESIHCLGPNPVRVAFDARACMKREYRIDQAQPYYFVLDDMDQLLTLDRSTLVALVRETQDREMNEAQLPGPTY